MVKVLRVLDGDTVTCEIDQGLNNATTETLRLLGVNTPETNSRIEEERLAGLRAKQYVIDALRVVPLLQWFAVVIPESVSPHEPVAMFTLSDQAQKWADQNYAGRAKVAPVTARVITGGDNPVTVKVRTEKPYSTDKYGRWLGQVLFRYKLDAPDLWRNLNADLIAGGYAVAYDGGAR
jgi:endonuclease YncB( thermonuclease family)